MKNWLFLGGLALASLSAQGEVLLDCGRIENFQNEISVHLPNDFEGGRFEVQKFGKRQPASQWKAGIEEKGHMPFRMVLIENLGPDTSREYLFQDFRGCFMDDDKPVALVIFKRTGEDRKLQRSTACRCQHWDY